jgi:hypothetical protein
MGFHMPISSMSAPSGQLIGEIEPELIRCLPPVPGLNAQPWLIVRSEMRSAVHVRAFVDFLAARMAKETQDRPPVLRGRRGHRDAGVVNTLESASGANRTPLGYPLID